MGGTFDPIHNGHLVAASEVADLFGLDEVVFVPTGEPWQKDRHVTAAEDRYLMTVIATAANPRFSVSRVDVDRTGATYTTDTLRDLQAGAAVGCSAHLVLTGKGEKFKGKALPDEFPAGTHVHADLSAFADWLIAQPEMHSKSAAKSAHKPGASA